MYSNLNCIQLEDATHEITSSDKTIVHILLVCLIVCLLAFLGLTMNNKKKYDLKLFPVASNFLGTHLNSKSYLCSGVKISKNSQGPFGLLMSNFGGPHNLLRAQIFLFR